MSTRSHIGKLNKDGTVRAIYCHFDGYFDHVGKILNEHYKKSKKIDELLDLGDLSSLGEEIGEKHNFDHRIEGVCNAYGRDRGEEDTEACEFESVDKFLDECHQDYTYLFKDNKWYVRSYSNKELRNLTEAIERAENED